MRAIQVTADTLPDPNERIGIISSLISETFSSSWSAESFGTPDPQADIHWSEAPGVALSHAKMSAFTLENATGCRHTKRKYYAFVNDQPQVIKTGGSASLYVPPQEFMILSSDVPCTIVTSRPYTTSSLVIDADLFMEHVPENYQGLIARRLRFPFGLHDILHATLDSCVAVSKAGKFDVAGPRLVRSFLEMLTLLDLDGGEPEHKRLSTGLDIRRAQVKAFIDKYFGIPDLSIAQIADKLQLTPRYIQMAFESDQVTPSEYLRRTRLKACAELLRDPKHARRSITDIAFCSGFNSSSHFSTEFKRAYGVSPREWRMESLRSQH